jgi:hypothetical protein
MQSSSKARRAVAPVGRHRSNVPTPGEAEWLASGQERAAVAGASLRTERGKTLAHVLRERAEHEGDREGFIFLRYGGSEAPREEGLTYGALLGRAQAIAAVLQAGGHARRSGPDPVSDRTGLHRRFLWLSAGGPGSGAGLSAAQCQAHGPVAGDSRRCRRQCHPDARRSFREIDRVGGRERTAAAAGRDRCDLLRCGQCRRTNLFHTGDERPREGFPARGITENGAGNHLLNPKNA